MRAGIAALFWGLRPEGLGELAALGAVLFWLPLDGGRSMGGVRAGCS